MKKVVFVVLLLALISAASANVFTNQFDCVYGRWNRDMLAYRLIGDDKSIYQVIETENIKNDGIMFISVSQVTVDTLFANVQCYNLEEFCFITAGCSIEEQPVAPYFENNAMEDTLID